jgi:integrase
LEIYDFETAIKRYRSIIARLRNGEKALSFLDHVASLGLSKASLAKYAGHLISLLRVIDFDLETATRKDVERVVAWINSRPFKEWTKRDKKLVLKKLIQYAKVGRCDRDSSYPPEVSWIKRREQGKGTRVTPEALLKREDFEAMVKAADNARDRALVYTLFEGALRPGELLGMDVGSVEFKDKYCLITVNGKTGLKRIPLVAAYRPLLEWLEQHPRRSGPDGAIVVFHGDELQGREAQLQALPPHNTRSREEGRAEEGRLALPFPPLDVDGAGEGVHRGAP